MDKQLPFDFDEQTYRKLNSPQPGRGEGIVHRANATNSHGPTARPSTRVASSFVHLLVGGVIVLQVVVIVATLIPG